MRAAGLLLAGLFVGALLAGCGRSGREPGLEWKGEPLPVARGTEAPTREGLRAEGYPDAAPLPRRALRASVPGLDSLRLFDYGDDVTAYLALQELATHPDDFAAGFAARDEGVWFRRGRWLGLLGTEAWMSRDVSAALGVPGTAAGEPSGPPMAFASLLRAERVEGSERVLTGRFLGLGIAGRVFAARLLCRGDTAWLYAAPGLGAEFALEAARALSGSVDSSRGMRVRAVLPGSDPLELRVFKRGTVAVEGCHDPALTEFWLKSQAKALNRLN